MATKIRNQKNRKATYLAALDPVSMADTTMMLLREADAPEWLIIRVHSLIKMYVSDFKNIATHLHSVDTINEFNDACKLRFAELTRLSGIIKTDAASMEEVEVYLSFGDGHLFNGRWSRSAKVVGLSPEDGLLELWQFTKNPGCYKWLFLANLVVINWAAHALEEGYQDAWDTAAWISLVLCSIGRLYEDLRPNAAYIDSEEVQDLQRLKADHDLNHDSVWWVTFQEVIADINEGTKPYIREMANAIKRYSTKVPDPFVYRDYHISFKKDGSSYLGQTYPSLYANLYEQDIPLPSTSVFDTLTGYTSHYNESPVEGVFQPLSKTITIEQHKVTRRVIHLGSNPVQDRLSYIHRRLQRVLDTMSTDCTRDQSRGVDFALQVTTPAFRDRNHNNVYSLDISKATDTIDIEFSKICLECIFDERIVQYWLDANTYPRVFCFNNGKQEEYTQLAGQAQGFKSSFPSFALAHHFVMLMVMHKHGLDRLPSRQFYRVLGDDSIISCVDPDESILDSYIDACSWIGWQTNRSKGYIARNGDPYAFAEFAKQRTLNGKVFTALPMKSLLNCEKTAQGTIGLFQWITNTLHTESIQDLFMRSPKLQRIYSQDEIDDLIHIVKSGVLPVFANWAEGRDANPRLYTDKEKMIILLSYFVVKLRATLVDCLLPDHFRDVGQKGFMEYKLEYLMNSKAEENLFDLAQDPDNKYYQVLQLNADMISYINSVIYHEDRPESDCWCQLQLGIDASEEAVIWRSLEIVEMSSAGIWPTDVVGAQLNLEQAVRILQRFNPRGDSREAHQSATIWTGFIMKYREIRQIYDQA